MMFIFRHNLHIFIGIAQTLHVELIPKRNGCQFGVLSLYNNNVVTVTFQN